MNNNKKVCELPPAAVDVLVKGAVLLRCFPRKKSQLHTDGVFKIKYIQMFDFKFGDLFGTHCKLLANT